MIDVRKRLRRWAYCAGYIEPELNAVVDRVYALIAHELAEKQRAVVKHHEELSFLSDLTPSKLIAAIDPEVLNSGEGEAVRPS